MSKYNSVDILFHFDVDADSPYEAKKQANDQYLRGTVGTCICNTVEYGQLPSIAEIASNGIFNKSKVIQELAEKSHSRIFDNSSTEWAIEKILPAMNLLEKAVEEIEKCYGRETDLSEKIRTFFDDLD